MKREDITYFTRRISQGNKSDIVVIIYDIYFAYEEDARLAIRERDAEALSVAIEHTTRAVSHLMEALNFAYDLSTQLYALYDFVLRAQARAHYKMDEGPLDEAALVMKELREAFIEVAKADDSGRQMQNAETVTAGYTYGRGSLSEYTEGGANRGFYA